MAQTSEAAYLSPATIDRAVTWYHHHTIPSAFRGLNPSVLVRAAQLADGDWQRCVVDSGGQSVVVYNYRVWDWDRE